MIKTPWGMVVFINFTARIKLPWSFFISSVHFSQSVMSDSLQPNGPQHTRPLCPSPTSRVYPNSCPSSQWCHPAISSSVVPLSPCPQSFPASGSFQMSQLFTSGGQSMALAKVFALLLTLSFNLIYLSTSSPFQVLPLHDLELSWRDQQMNPSPQPLSQHCPSTRAPAVYDGHDWQGNMSMTLQMPPPACTSLLLQKHMSGQSPALAVCSIMCLSCVFPEELNTSGENVHTLSGNRTLQ